MDHFAQNWLAIQCKMIGNCQQGLLLMLKPGSHQFTPLAQWPPASQVDETLLSLTEVVVQTLEQAINSNVNRTSENAAYDYLAVPIMVNSLLVGILAVKIVAKPQSEHQQIFTQLKQSLVWLELATVERRFEVPTDFYLGVVKLTAVCFDQPSYPKALYALISELSKHFQCERVAIGEIRHKHAHVVALSNSSKFDTRTSLMRNLADVMDEAVEQDAILVFPPGEQQQNSLTLAHAELADKFGAGAICTIPLMGSAGIFAALTLERNADHPFKPDTVRLLEQAMLLIGPYLEMKKAEEAGFFEQIRRYFRNRLFGNLKLQHVGLKLAGLAFVAVMVGASLIRGEFRVHAKAVLEGKVQRMITAPMDGFILTASARAGDTVKQGEVMAEMDDADLKLEAMKLTSELQKSVREYREALANRDLSNVSVLSAKVEQTQAQQQLIYEQLARTAITAPFEGVVIDGDLSQLLGSPVERGKNLFKIAPLDGYRIILKVNERLISYVSVGQSGTLSLSSIPDRLFPLTVQKITAISKVEEGENIFRVEASLSDPDVLLRPGMAGVGKINAGERALLWIWTHEMIDWLRLWVWAWLP